MDHKLRVLKVGHKLILYVIFEKETKAKKGLGIEPLSAIFRPPLSSRAIRKPNYMSSLTSQYLGINSH